ncbi:hypothetical protein CHU95_04125 [Niveispirillum lacus]|uniref:DUF4148 domain-containing protein n=1 Tax=Niveispirillum lacus TaxID=1981099 RepID=A0A255Z693_9PROT|nr:hypothetical protein [Niveispirillum lacus]OYQ36425.1 hypothetical protein CHU95_04125 [Niveispirillum lacus]
MSAYMRFPALTLLFLALAGPVVAQQAKPQPEVMDEVIVTAPRNGEPGFQEDQEYHQKEYQRLHAMFGKPPAAQPRGDQIFASGGTMSAPNDRSPVREQIESAPRLRDTFGGN